MSNRQPSNLRVVVGYETAFNSGQTTPAGYDIPKASCSFGASEQIGDSDEIKSDPNPTAPIRGMWSTAGDLVEAVEDTGIGILAKAFLTGYAKAGTAAPYSHTFKISTAAPSSLWVEIGDTGITKYDLYKGVIVRSLAVSVTKAAQVLKATWGLIGSGDKTLNGGTAYAATPTAFTTLRAYMRDCTVSIGGTASAFISDINFTVTRDVQMPAVLDGLTKSPSYVAGAFTVKGQITALFEDTDAFRGYVTGDTEIVVALRCPRPGAATKYVEFQFNEAKLGLSTAPSIAGRSGLVSVVCDLYGYYQDDAGASAFTMVLANDQSTSY